MKKLIFFFGIVALLTNIKGISAPIPRTEYILPKDNALERAATYERIFSLSGDTIGLCDYNKVTIIPLDAGYEKIDFLNDSVYCGFLACYKKVPETKHYSLSILDLGGKEINKPFDLPTLGSIRFVRVDNKKYYFEVSCSVGSLRGPIENMTSIINVDGSIIIPFRKDVISYDASKDEFYVQRELTSNELENSAFGTFKDNRERMYLGVHLGNSNKYEYYKNLGNTIIKEIDKNLSNPPIFSTNHIETNGFAWTKLEKGYGNDKVFSATTILGDSIIPFDWNIKEIKYMNLSHNMGCFEIGKDYHTGIASLKGSIIVPIDYVGIRYLPIEHIGGLFEALDSHKDCAVYDLNGNKIVGNMHYICYSELKDHKIGYFLVERDGCFGAYDIYGNIIVPFGEKGDFLQYDNKYGFAFNHEKRFSLGITLDEYGGADYSLKKKWDREKREREERERRRKKQQRRNFWVNFTNALAHSAMGYLSMNVYGGNSGWYNNAYSVPSYTPNYDMGSVANQLSNPSYFKDVYQELMFTSIAQIQQQEMWEYNQDRQSALAFGKDLSLDEWRCQRGAAINALKEEGIDLIAEQQARNREISDFNRSSWNSGKENVQRIKEENRLKMGGTSASPISSTGAQYASTSLSERKSTKSASNSSNLRSSTESHLRTSFSSSESKDNEEVYDAHQQFKNGNYNTNSSDYQYKRRVTLYRQEGAKFRVVKQNAEVYEKGAKEYIKIGNTFYPATSPQKITEFHKRIVYGGVGLYYN